MAKENKKESKKEEKKKIKRGIAKEERNRGKKNEKKTQKKKVNTKKKKSKEEESQNEEDEESFEDFILPGQKNSTPPAGDATRAFYESLLEQRPDSLMAKKYCVEYGCLDAEKATEFLKELEKKKKKK